MTYFEQFLFYNFVFSYLNQCFGVILNCFFILHFKLKYDFKRFLHSISQSQIMLNNMSL